MIAMLFRRLALTLFLALLWLGLIEYFNPAPPRLLLVHADYQRCVRISPPLVNKRGVARAQEEIT